MTVIDRLLSALDDGDRETYVCYLREVVGEPGVGGYGQYLGSLVPIIFASDEQKLEALRRMSQEAA